jgi:serine/threonine protein kinase
MKDYLQQNILIDDGGRALLCDFGLARVKTDIMSRSTTTDGVVAAGSRYWMAPERLMGKKLRKPCDIYSFGITSYEVILILGRISRTSQNLITPTDLCRRDSIRLYQSR